LKTDYKDLKASISCCNKKGYNRLWLVLDMIYSTLMYGSSFVDFFNFRFYKKKHTQRSAYATMGYMYKYHREMNNQYKQKEIDSKELFPKKFDAFCNQSYVFSKKEIFKITDFFKSRIGQHIVFKDPNSTAGKSINIALISSVNNSLLIGEKPIIEFLEQSFLIKDTIYCEDFIYQHDSINEISSSGVNTLRIITVVTKSKTIDIIGAIFRISVESPIDNYSAGNLAAEIDIKTGVVATGGIRKRSACDYYHDIHPITNKQIKGFKIPFWEETIEMIKKAAIIVPEVRTVGWDIAITNTGPILIEGNSQWNKDTFQIPAGKGKKEILEKYR